MERMVSPGVFTQESDQSFLPQGIAEIGAAFVGPMAIGPAFRPTIVSSQQEFVKVFGQPTSDSYTSLAVQEYLKNAGRCTVVRILGLFGYDSNVNKSVLISVSGTEGKFPLALVHPSQAGVTVATASVSGTATSFTLSLSGSAGSSTSSMSADPTSPNYITSVLGNGSNASGQGYVFADFPRAFNSISLSGSASVIVEALGTRFNFSGSIYGRFSNAVTPWIQSQTIGAARQNLFRFWTFSDGTAANQTIKISITNVRDSSTVGDYGTFSLLIRQFTDTDNKPVIVEQFDNLTLDPLSVNYVLARIGTSKPIFDVNGNVYIDGDYPKKSAYVYMEPSATLETVAKTALPYGFAPLTAPVQLTTIPAPAYVSSSYRTIPGSTTPVSSPNIYYGVNLADPTTVSYCNPIPSGSLNSALDLGFSFESLATPDLSDIALATSLTNKALYRKFTVPFQGGFDGFNPGRVKNLGNKITSTNTMGFDLSDSSKPGAVAYTQALNALANPDEFDINMIVLPGVIHSQHSYITTKAISVCQSRGDCFFIMDPDTLDATVDSAVSNVQGLDSSYAGAYYPWVKIRDNNSGRLIWVPPSVVMPGIYAFNDRVAAEWFVPAGLSRGGIDSAVAVKVRLNHTDRDNLYEGHINPIATFPSQGIVAWGNTTLQVKESALSSINIRRLLIAAKKFIASSSRYLVFEQNVESTRQRFLNIANPYFASVQERRGLYAFKVVMDSSNNTNDLIDRKVLVGEIYLQPTRAAEKISLTFNVLATGAVFPSG